MPEYLFALAENRFSAAKPAANPKKTACLACHCCYNTTRQIGSSNAEKGAFFNAIGKVQYDIRKWRI
jgi:hypothetical protein